MLKRVFDIIFSLAGIALCLPVFLVSAVLIKMDSPGPVFYAGTRSGKNGKLFKMYKFRTMLVGKEKKGGDTTAFNDPRVTRTGKFLRKYKIDEIPQLINVLMGEMSIVGPRPELPFYTERYSDEEKIILSLRPGITDYSSIEFRDLDKIVGDDDPGKVFEEEILPRKNELRVKYVKMRTFSGDISIIVRTLAAVLARS